MWIKSSQKIILLGSSKAISLKVLRIDAVTFDFSIFCVSKEIW